MKDKSIVIIGPAGSGKTTVAKIIAGALGAYIHTTEYQLRNRFLDVGPIDGCKTMIVEECGLTKTSIAWMKTMASEYNIVVNERCLHPKIYTMPRIIFIMANDAEALPLENNRRFVVMEAIHAGYTDK